MSDQDILGQVQSTDGRQKVGVVVDGVSDVVDISAADIHQAPDFGSGFSTEYIRGLANVANRMVVLIDIDRLIGTRLTRLSSPQQGSEASVEAA
jgi:purine-binding chemotaxis protein CheW